MASLGKGYVHILLQVVLSEDTRRKLMLQWSSETLQDRRLWSDCQEFLFYHCKVLVRLHNRLISDFQDYRQPCGPDRLHDNSRQEAGRRSMPRIRYNPYGGL